MDIYTLDLRVHEVLEDGITTFYIVHRGTNDPVNDYVAILKAGSDAESTRDLAHLMANAPDMQRAGNYHLVEKRHVDPSLFANLKFREISEERFKEELGGELPRVTPSPILEDALNKVELPPQKTEFPATYTSHTENVNRGIGKMGVADLNASEQLDELSQSLVDQGYDLDELHEDNPHIPTSFDGGSED